MPKDELMSTEATIQAELRLTLLAISHPIFPPGLAKLLTPARRSTRGCRSSRKSDSRQKRVLMWRMSSLHSRMMAFQVPANQAFHRPQTLRAKIWAEG